MKAPFRTGLVLAAFVATADASLVTPCRAAESAAVEVAFAPDAGVEQLVLRAIGDTHESIRVLAYSFTAEPVARALIDARRRGVDVAVTVDYRENIDEDRSGRAHAALSALARTGVAVRVVRTLTVHSKYIVIDGQTVETGAVSGRSRTGL